MHFSGDPYVHVELIDPESGAPLPFEDGAEGELVYSTLSREAMETERRIAEANACWPIRVFFEALQASLPTLAIAVRLPPTPSWRILRMQTGMASVLVRHTALVPRKRGLIDNGCQHFRVPPLGRPVYRLIVALAPRPPT